MRAFSFISSSLLAVAACGSTPDESSTSDPVIVSTAPYRYDSPYSIVMDLGTSGIAAPPSSPTALDPYQTHDGTFTTGRTTGHLGTTDPVEWSSVARGADWMDFESSPALVTDLDAARASADSTLAGLSVEKLEELRDLLKLFPLPIVVGDPVVEHPFYGWLPVQARWQRSQYVTTSSTGAMTKEIYADPLFGGEIRERGARLYCAAREANLHQSESTVSMGRQVALALDVLGHEVDLGVVEATFALDGPKKLTGDGANDGAQAFEIPMLIGTAVTPIDGLGLPGFGELRHPIVLTSGDSEVASGTAPQWLHDGDGRICNGARPRPVCQVYPLYAFDSPMDYLTVTHADAVVSGSATMHIEVPQIPVFTLGAFTVTLGGSGDVNIGKSSVPPPQDRLLASTPTGWPAARAGELTPSPFPGWNYDSEPWYAAFDVDAPLATNAWFDLPAIGTPQVLAPNDPMLMRVLADDDHHVATTSDVDLVVKVTGEFPFQLGIAEFRLWGDGTIGLDVAHTTDVRDGVNDLMNHNSGIPYSALTVTPSTSATTTVHFGVYLHIYIDLFIDSIDETLTIVTAGAGKTWGGSPWDQQNRALITTGSSYGDVTNQPWAYSHLPSPSLTDPATWPLFNSFDQSVPQCLADTREIPKTPEPCKPTAQGGPPSAQLCVFSGSWLVNQDIGAGTPGSWAGVCSDIAGHVATILPGATSDQQGCYVDTLSYLCSPTSKEQDWNGQHGVAHVVPLASPDVDLGTLAKRCAKAFYPDTGPKIFNRIFEFGVCDASATMIDKDKVVTQKSSADSTPNPVTDGTCHTPK